MHQNDTEIPLNQSSLQNSNISINAYQKSATRRFQRRASRKMTNPNITQAIGNKHEEIKKKKPKKMILLEE